MNHTIELVDSLFPFAINGEKSVLGDSKIPSENNGPNVFPEMKEVPAHFRSPCPSLKVFKFADLEKITRNFSLDLLLGEGGFGKVFLGWVEQNTLAPSKQGLGIGVAVKRLNREGLQGRAEWQTEVNFLGYMDHPNIIRLLGYCEDEHEHLVVYEHMSNKSFDHFLFPDVANTVEPLSWETRLLILIGVARGITYSHSANIICRGLKSADILLDEDFNAKLGDLGLVKDGRETGGTHISTRVMGTYGYAAPEYMSTGHLTMRCDIYAFGVVLLESITGRRAMDYKKPTGEQQLLELFTRIQINRRNLKKIMDHRLEHNYPVQGALECIALALRCIANKPKDRPSSKEVLQSLEQIYELKK